MRVFPSIHEISINFKVKDSSCRPERLLNLGVTTKNVKPLNSTGRLYSVVVNGKEGVVGDVFSRTKVDRLKYHERYGLWLET